MFHSGHFPIFSIFCRPFWGTIATVKVKLIHDFKYFGFCSCKAIRKKKVILDKQPYFDTYINCSSSDMIISAIRIKTIYACHLNDTLSD